MRDEDIFNITKPRKHMKTGKLYTPVSLNYKLYPSALTPLPRHKTKHSAIREGEMGEIERALQHFTQNYFVIMANNLSERVYAQIPISIICDEF